MTAYPSAIPGTAIKIIDNLAVLSINESKHTQKDLNLIEVPENGINTLYFDIAEWNFKHTSRSPWGLTLREDEMQTLVDALYDSDIIASEAARTIEDYENMIFNDDIPEQSDPDQPIPGQMSMEI